MSWHKKGFQVSKHDNKLGNKGQIEVETETMQDLIHLSYHGHVHTGTLTTIFSRIPVKAVWKGQNIS